MDKNQKEARRVAEGGEADQRSQRSLDKKQAVRSQIEGPAAYAPQPDEPHSKKEEGEGGAGKPKTSPLEPEKQGGIGGP
jgi:hypothetical protein